MKKWLSILLLTALLLGVLCVSSAFAELQTGYCGPKLTWTLDEDGVLTISGTGPMTNYEWEESPFFNNDRIHSVVFEDGVTSVGSNAFPYSPIVSVSFPDSMTRIEEGAFFCIYSLQEITVPKNVTFIALGAFAHTLSAFQVAEENQTYSAVNGVLFNKAQDSLFIYPDHKADVNYTVPEGVKVICEFAFTDCRNLVNVTLSESLETVEQYAFNSCYSLETVVIPQQVQHIGYHAFADSKCLISIQVDPDSPYFVSIDGVLFDKGMYTLIQYPAGRAEATYQIPDGVKNVDSAAFYACTSLTGVSIPDSVTIIDGEAFAFCYQLSDIALPRALRNIPWAMFSNCYSLTELVIPASVTEISDEAFRNCVSLTSVTIPASVSWIGDTAFAECSDALTLFVRPNSYALQYADAHHIRPELNTSPATTVDSGFCGKNLTWKLDEDGVLTISGTGPMTNYQWEGSPFYNNLNIYSIVVEEGVTSIGVDAFPFCGASSVFLPDSLTRIEEAAFFCMSFLSEITIPKNVDYIAGQVFSHTLAAFQVAPENETFSAVDGVLFNKAQDTLILYPDFKPDTQYTVPEGVTAISYDAFCNNRNLVSVTLPESLITIGDYAFNSCISLETIVMSRNVQSLGYNVFASSERLTSIQVDSNNADFVSVDGVLFSKSMDKLIQYPAGRSDASYQIPDGVAQIGASAFEACLNLTEIGIPESVNMIYSQAFYRCEQLQRITLPSGLENIDWGLFHGCASLTELVIPYGVTAIQWDAFMDCSSLISLTIPSSVEHIDNGVFENCSDALTLFVRPNSYALQYADAHGIHRELDTSPAAIVGSGVCGKDVTWTLDADGVLTISGTGPMTDYQWEESPFFNNKSIHTIVVENGVTSIGASAFMFCSASSVFMPDSLTRIEDSAFNYMDNLLEITIPKSVNSIASGAFTYTLEAFHVSEENQVFSAMDGVLFNKAQDSLIRYPEHKTDAQYTVPEGVSSICESAFMRCGGLASVTLPESLETIGDYGFNQCTSLKTVIIPRNVQSIGIEAFDDCKSIISIQVDANNQYFTSVDGVLFNKGMDTLIQYPAGRPASSYEVPSGVTAISPYAFCSCFRLKSVSIPDSVTIIGYQAL